VKSKFFFILSLVLVFSLMAPMSGSTHDLNANSGVGGDLSTSSYSISGKVTDLLGNPVPNVTITANITYLVYIPLLIKSDVGLAGKMPKFTRDQNLSANKSKAQVEPVEHSEANTQTHSGGEKLNTGQSINLPSSSYTTQSDVNGDYSFTGLPADEYTLVASQSGYSFTPLNRTISLPPNATNLNYIRHEMVLIPEGNFQMGCDPAHNGGYDCYTSELPLHTVYLDAYNIDKYEVTNDQMATFLNSRGSNDCNDYECVDLDDHDLRISYMGGQYVVDSGYGDHPVVEVTWYGADAFCTENGKRLPSEAEWEKAARGTTLRAYPWGDSDPTCELVNYWPNEGVCVGDTAPVGSYLAGASPYGVMDMAGNVWEWVNDWYSYSYYSSSPTNNPPGPATGDYRVLHGGSWHQIELNLRVAYRDYFNPDFSYFIIGFRCAVSTPGE
jgi:formylglycine-generating enzyme required for sulfatase activity